MSKLLLISTIAIALISSGCGSARSIVPTEPHALSELAGSDKVIVLDFNNGTTSKEPEKVKTACKSFANKIANQISATTAFADVNRAGSLGKAIVLNGTITRYEEGNPVVGLFVGFGTGDAYLDADIIFKDNESGNQLATLKVDRNSWGWVAGTEFGPQGVLLFQDVEIFMDEAAKKVAQDLVDAKNKKSK